MYKVVIIIIIIIIVRAKNEANGLDLIWVHNLFVKWV